MISPLEICRYSEEVSMIKASAKPTYDHLRAVRKSALDKMVYISILLYAVIVGFLIRAAVLLVPALRIALKYNDSDHIAFIGVIFLFSLWADVVIIMRIFFLFRVLMFPGKTKKDKPANDFVFNDECFFVRTETVGFLCERSFVYSTLKSAVEYGDYFIFRTNVEFYVFGKSEITEGSDMELRRLLMEKMGERFRVKA